MDGCRTDVTQEGRPEEAALALLVASLAELARQEHANAAVGDCLGAGCEASPYPLARGDFDL